MKPPPRRPQPSWIAHLGRRLIRHGSLAVVTAALVLLLGFVLGALGLGALLGHGRAAAADADPAAGTPSFEAKLGVVDRALGEVLSELGLSAPGANFEYSADRTEGGRTFRHRYRAIPYATDLPFEEVREAIRERISDPQADIRVRDSEIDAKTFQVQVLIEGLPTHAMLFTRSRAEDDSGREAVSLEQDDARIPEQLRRGNPRVALLIDDIGYRGELDRRFLTIPAPITFSVLPFSPNGADFARRAHAADREVLLHMPMEPIDFPAKSPGRGALYLADPPEKIVRSLRAAMDAVPHIVGMNNHMGSRFTQSRERMAIVLATLSERRLFFVDSLTHVDSVGYDLAQEMGVPTARRNVFLDNEPEPGRVNERLAQLVSEAQRHGFALGIGHPNQATLQALKTYLPNLRRRGVEVVPVSELVH